MKKRRTIPAGRFKAECLALLDRVANTGEPLLVTKRGKPVAEVVPAGRQQPPPLRGSVTTLEDIVGPVLEPWDVER